MRRSSTPALDLVPVMGLASLLIPLLLLGQGVPFATIEVTAPQCACGGIHDPEVDHSVVPTVHLGRNGIRMLAAGEEHDLEAGQLHRLGELLGEVWTDHETNGKIILVADSDVEYERLITAMDTARPHFPDVTVAGGVL